MNITTMLCKNFFLYLRKIILWRRINYGCCPENISVIIIRMINCKIVFNICNKYIIIKCRNNKFFVINNFNYWINWVFYNIDWLNFGNKFTNKFTNNITILLIKIFLIEIFLIRIFIIVNTEWINRISFRNIFLEIFIIVNTELINWFFFDNIWLSFENKFTNNITITMEIFMIFNISNFFNSIS